MKVWQLVPSALRQVLKKSFSAFALEYQPGIAQHEARHRTPAHKIVAFIKRLLTFLVHTRKFRISIIMVISARHCKRRAKKEDAEKRV